MPFLLALGPWLGKRLRRRGNRARRIKSGFGWSCLGESFFSNNGLAFIAVTATPGKYCDTKPQGQKEYPRKHFSELLYEHGYSSFAKKRAFGSR
jgi:hypothetical protein